jgi:hypothetical protein
MRFDINQLNQLDQRAKSGQMTTEDRRLLVALIKSHTELVNLLKDPDTSLKDLYAYLPSDKNDTATDGAACDRSDSLPEARDE